MSLVALALRVATIKALRGATLCQDRVFDSPMEPLDVTIEGEQGPYLAVYIDREDHRPMVKDMLSGEDRSFEIVIHCMLPERAQLVGSDGVTYSIDTSDKGGELVQNIINRQIVRALQASDGLWANVWRDFVINIERLMSRPYLIELQPDVRMSARELQLTVTGIDEPSFGQGMHEPWESLLTAMEGDSELAPIAKVIEAELTDTGALPDWRQAMVAQNISLYAVRGIGLAPMDTTQTTDEADPLGTIIIDGGGVTTQDPEAQP